MSAIRALRQVAAPLARRSLLNTPAASRVAGMRVALPSAFNSALSRGFASSASRLSNGSTDVVLAQKLQEELSYEKETGGATEDVPQFVKDFNAQGVWTVTDAPGHDEVVLTRKFGNENLRLIFSSADLQAVEEEFEGEDAEETQEPTYPIRASLSVTKNNGPGALNVDMLAQEGGFIVDNISFYEDAQVGTDLTAEADWKRRGLYIGPQFDTLDVGLQEQFEAFLKERGIDEGVAMFIPAYAQYKEQKEYVKWLNKVRAFVEA